MTVFCTALLYWSLSEQSRDTIVPEAEEAWLLPSKKRLEGGGGGVAWLVVRGVGVVKAGS